MDAAEMMEPQSVELKVLKVFLGNIQDVIVEHLVHAAVMLHQECEIPEICVIKDVISAKLSLHDTG